VTATIYGVARSDIVARSKLYKTLKVRRNLSSVSNTFKMFFTITAISTFASSNRIVKAGYISNCRVIACKAPVSRLRPAPNNKRANRRNRKRASRQWRGSEHRFRGKVITIRVNSHQGCTKLLITRQFRRNWLHKNEGGVEVLRTS